MLGDRCIRCNGNLYTDIDISLEGPLYHKCLQCGREYRQSGESVSRLADWVSESCRGVKHFRHYGRPKLPVAV